MYAGRVYRKQLTVLGKYTLKEVVMRVAHVTEVIEQIICMFIIIYSELHSSQNHSSAFTGGNICR